MNRGHPPHDIHTPPAAIYHHIQHYQPQPNKVQRHSICVVLLIDKYMVIWTTVFHSLYPNPHIPIPHHHSVHILPRDAVRANLHKSTVNVIIIAYMSLLKNVCARRETQGGAYRSDLSSFSPKRTLFKQYNPPLLLSKDTSLINRREICLTEGKNTEKWFSCSRDGLALGIRLMIQVPKGWGWVGSDKKPNRTQTTMPRHNNCTESFKHVQIVCKAFFYPSLGQTVVSLGPRRPMGHRDWDMAGRCPNKSPNKRLFVIFMSKCR